MMRDDSMRAFDAIVAAGYALVQTNADGCTRLIVEHVPVVGTLKPICGHPFVMEKTFAIGERATCPGCIAYFITKHKQETIGMDQPKTKRYFKTISIDFDGVIHAYTSPFTTSTDIHDGPVDGALQFIRDAFDRGYGIQIHTARANDSKCEAAIVDWLHKHGLEVHYIDNIIISQLKKGAVVYIDDRGFRFEGQFPTFDQIEAFQQWNKSKVQR
jgi:hypothetical protein